MKKAGKNNYLSGILNLPKNMRELYPHSLQSIIWNQVVSKRLEKHGFKAIEGDIVYNEKDEKFEILDSVNLPNFTICDVYVSMAGNKDAIPSSIDNSLTEELLGNFGLSNSDFNGNKFKFL